MSEYYVIKCGVCGAVRYVRAWQKTYYCFKCRKQRPVSKAIILCKVKGIKDATYVVQWIKTHGLRSTH